jgi:hypothetical protein
MLAVHLEVQAVEALQLVAALKCATVAFRE